MAQSIPLINAGFENPPAKPGVMTTGGIPGWPATSPAPTVGVANLPATMFFPPTDGSQVGYMAGQQHSLNQNLTAVSNANTTYLAGIDCYALISQPQADSKLAVLLRVGGNLVASAFCDPHGVTNSVTLIFQTTEFTSVDLIGKPFDFELVADLPDGNHLTFFDHARLTAYPSNGLSGLHPPIGPGKGQTAHSAIRCAGSIICSVTLEFVDAGGVLLAQEQARVPPGGIQTLDFSPARQGHDSMEVVSRWFLESGSATFSLQLSDDSDLRTKLLINWGDGSVSKMGNLDSGPVSLGRGDTGRLKVYCDGSVRVEATLRVSSCQADLAFQDANGRTLKTSHLSLAPGTMGFLDFTPPPTGDRAMTVVPTLTVSGGPAVGAFALLDQTGATTTQSSPALTQSIVR